MRNVANKTTKHHAQISLSLTKKNETRFKPLEAASIFITIIINS